MSIKVTYNDGVFEPLEEVKGARQGQRYMMFSDEELEDLSETLAWLKTAEKPSTSLEQSRGCRLRHALKKLHELSGHP